MVWQFRGRELRSKIGEQRGWHGEFSSDLRIKKEVTVKVKVETHLPHGRMKQDVGAEARCHRLAGSVLPST